LKLLLGLDIGSSFIKASLLDAEENRALLTVSSPEKEMNISSPQRDWAQQDPEEWWQEVKKAVRKLRAQHPFNSQDVLAIGISYQMHGLVLVDKNQKVLRPAIIWCDSRAAGMGEAAAEKIGKQKCLQRLLNLPGNFTAAKLRWVQQNEPEVYQKIYKFMLPGDFMAMKLTGEIKTTPSGLSEGILWDYRENSPASLVLNAMDISPDLLPSLTPNFSVQGEITPEAAEELGLSTKTIVAYRAGDQPNNALSLKVLDPGEVAVTAGTSGVIYGVIDRPIHDPQSRVNPFLHVNHESQHPRYGVLLCLNGTGILNRWARQVIGQESTTYEEMNSLAQKIDPGAENLFIYPYGNGAERTLENRNPGASICGINFNRHGKEHFYRATQEGIVFALHYGLNIMKGMASQFSTVRAGHANMFLSPVFGEIFSAVTGTTVELYNTDGAQGAARGAGLGMRYYKDRKEAFRGLQSIHRIEPDATLSKRYQEIYSCWETHLPVGP
jgi:xylulokinase